MFRINSSGQGGFGTAVSNSLFYANGNNVGSGQVLIRARANSGQTVDVASFEESGGTAHVKITKATSSVRANLVMGSAALATGATDGFIYASSMAGTPSGTPTSNTGTVPIVIDTTASKLWAYIGGAWKSVTLA